MSVGFIMMCHTALNRAEEVAHFMARAGSPVVIHVDASVSQAEFEAFRRSVSDTPLISFSRRYVCEWGTWSLVAATLAAAEQLLARAPDLGHVFLASGACLPLRPVSELRAYLEAHPHTDFIESVTTRDVGWVQGGLDMERFTLRFPFAWRRHKQLFDGYVRLQRYLGRERTLPEGLTPHLGSQWWCLSQPTLRAILEDTSRPVFDRFFRRVWIPDESYFQSLARRHSEHIESRSLTLATFDFQGKPHVFYDDHLQLLRRSECFMARKIWPRADRLYAAFLKDRPPSLHSAEPDPTRIDRLFARAVERRTRGRPGLYMQSRFPAKNRENGKTCGPYSVFQGFSDIFVNFEAWLAKHVGARVHGHLFAPDKVHFSGGDKLFSGCLTDSAVLRDYDPRGFLTNLIWNTRGERQCYMFSPADLQKLNWFTATDPNAQISVISGAWAVPLMHEGGDFTRLRKKAARLQRRELAQLEILRSAYVKARVRIWSLSDFMENPAEPLQTVIDEISPRNSRRVKDIPEMADLTGFGQFLQKLRNEGMKPRVMGDFPAHGAPYNRTRRPR